MTIPLNNSTQDSWDSEDVNIRLIKLKLRKMELSKMIGVNPNTVYSVISGYMINKDVRKKILAKIAELEQQSNQAS